MVGVAGFKPTTSPTPRVRANQAAPYSAKFLKTTIKLFDDILRRVAPDAGFEPATKRLTAAYSTAELIRNKKE